MPEEFFGQVELSDVEACPYFRSLGSQSRSIEETDKGQADMNLAHAIKTVAFGGSIALATAALSSMAAADDATTTDGPLVLAQQVSEFDDATIEAFAAAQVRVEQIREEYSALYAEAASDEERVEIINTANAELFAAVEEAPGITPQEYDALVTAASEDPALMERVSAAIAEAGF